MTDIKNGNGKFREKNLNEEENFKPRERKRLWQEGENKGENGEESSWIKKFLQDIHVS